MRTTQTKQFRNLVAGLLLVAIAALSAGCEDQYITMERYDQGLVLL